MTRLVGSLFLLSALGIASTVAAEEPAGPAPANEAAAGPAGAASPAAVTAPTVVPKDPKGIKGISPFWEALNRGDAAFAAQDMDTATNEYRAAITGSPQNPLGHLRMAEVAIKLKLFTKGQEFIAAALRFGQNDMRYKAQAAFLLAQLRELQDAPDDATDSWNKYKALDSALPQATELTEDHKGPLPPRVYVATADERLRAIAARKKMLADYAPVAERIKKNVEAADKATGQAAGK